MELRCVLYNRIEELDGMQLEMIKGNPIDGQKLEDAVSILEDDVRHYSQRIKDLISLIQPKPKN